jgi:hypothetical protein
MMLYVLLDVYTDVRCVNEGCVQKEHTRKLCLQKFKCGALLLVLQLCQPAVAALRGEGQHRSSSSATRHKQYTSNAHMQLILAPSGKS